MNQPSNIHIGQTIGIYNDEDFQDRPDKIETSQQLAHAITSANDVLCRAKTVFPFTLFPDTIAVDRTKVTIIKRFFWKSGETISLRMEHIQNVTAQAGPFFGNIKITTKYFNPNVPYIAVNMLQRDDALRVKRILQGYLIARQNKVDMSALSTAELAAHLDELGKVEDPEKL